MNQYLNWLSPVADVTMAAPRPVVTLTESPPIMLHTEMYHSMLFLPYLGAKYRIMTREATIRTAPQARKPGERKSFWNSRIWPTDASCGPLRAMITDPSWGRSDAVQAPRVRKTYDAERASEPSEEAQLFLQEYGGEDGGNDDG